MRKMLLATSLISSLSSFAVTVPPPPPAGPSTHMEMDSSFDDANYDAQVILYKQGKQSIQRFHKINQKRNQEQQTQAADFFTNPQVDYNFSYAWVDDNLFQANGDNSTHTLSLSGDLGDMMFAGLSVENDLYEVKSSQVSFEQNTSTASLFLGIAPSENWSFALFYSLSQVDLERGSIFGTPLAAQGTKMGAGLIASYNNDLSETVNLGITTSIASLNKSSFDGLLDNEDTQAIIVADLYTRISDNFALDPFISAVTLIDREHGSPDGAYGSAGMDAFWTINEHWSTKIGYERLVADDSRDEDRINLGAVYRF